MAYLIPKNAQSVLIDGKIPKQDSDPISKNSNIYLRLKLLGGTPWPTTNGSNTHTVFADIHPSTRSNEENSSNGDEQRREQGGQRLGGQPRMRQERGTVTNEDVLTRHNYSPNYEQEEEIQVESNDESTHEDLEEETESGEEESESDEDSQEDDEDSSDSDDGQVSDWNWTNVMEMAFTRSQRESYWEDEREREKDRRKEELQRQQQDYDREQRERESYWEDERERDKAWRSI